MLLALGNALGCYAVHQPGAPDDGSVHLDASVGHPDGAVPMPTHCDDGNPCTIGRAYAGECRFDAVEEGTSCDDGDFCTLGDRCHAGRCQADTRAEGSLSVVSSLAGLYGAHVAVGPGRFLTVSRRHAREGRVQLVARTAEGLSVLSSWQGPMVIPARGPEDILTEAIGTGGTIAVTTTTTRTLHVFTVSPENVIEAHPEFEMPGQVVSMSARGDMLWTCTGGQVTMVDLSDPSAPAIVASLGFPSGCGSLAVNDDGRRVYVNTATGVRFIDTEPLAHGGALTLGGVASEELAGVDFSGGHLVLTRPAEVRILRELEGDPSVEQVVSVPIEGARAATLTGDRLLIEGSRVVSGHAQHFIASYDALGTEGPALLDEVVLLSVPSGSPGTSKFRSATDGQTLISGLASRMFDFSRGRLEEVRVPALVRLGRLARTSDGVHAYGAASAAKIDMTDVLAPFFAAGGAFGTSAMNTIAMDESLPEPTLVAGPSFLAPGRLALFSAASGAVNIERWSLTDQAEREVEGSFPLPRSGGSELMIAGNFLYHLSQPAFPLPGVELLAYWLPALRSAGAATIAPAFHLNLASSGSAAGFDVDARARVAVVSIERPNPAGDLERALVWLDLSATPPAVVDELLVAELHRSIRVSGDRVAAQHSSGVVFYQRGQGEVGRAESDRRQERLLGFDGQVAYSAQVLLSPTGTYELAAAPFGRHGPPEVLPLGANPESLVAAGGALVLGFDSELIAVHPHCLAP